MIAVDDWGLTVAEVDVIAESDLEWSVCWSTLGEHGERGEGGDDGLEVEGGLHVAETAVSHE